MTPEELADRLEHAAKQIAPAIRRGVEHTGTLGNARIRGDASGRPGPNVITGKYRNSWKTVTKPLPHGALCTIGTNAPQGRRLEFGFYDMTDSLGRHYFQPPFPHVGPAIPFITSTLTYQMKLAITEALQ